jgi:hypothetical protein
VRSRRKKPLPRWAKNDHGSHDKGIDSDIDTLETIADLQEDSAGHKHNAGLNGAVAVKVAQADKIDPWNFCQARNIREEVALAAIEQMTLDCNLRPEAERGPHDAVIVKYEAIVKSRNSKNSKKEDRKTQAEKTQMDDDSLQLPRRPVRPRRGFDRHRAARRDGAGAPPADVMARAPARCARAAAPPLTSP